ncbi:hypothetical protein ACFQX4_07855 [Roseomonas sp. GCM10028921]
MTGLAEAWLLAFILAASLGAGSLAVLSSSILLRERWVEPLLPLLSAAARAVPVLILLALPLVLMAGDLYPWAGQPRGVAVLAAGAAILSLWAALGRLLPRPSSTRWRAGLSLLLIALSAAIGFEDWALSRDPRWAGSLNGIGLMVGGAAASLALAVLAHGQPVDAEARTGLERALLTLGIAVLWFLFVAFLTVWAADLPAEAAWYLRRTAGAWFWLKTGLALPALLGAIALSVVPQWRPWRMRAVCALLVMQHGAIVLWSVRPDVALAPGGTRGGTSPLLDAIVIAAMVLVLVLAGRLAGRAETRPV